MEVLLPVYRCRIRGDDKVRLVQARSQSQAAKHLVDAESVSADEMAELLGKGTELETYAGPADDGDEPPADPAKDSK
jgi:hypothetical protein